MFCVVEMFTTAGSSCRTSGAKLSGAPRGVTTTAGGLGCAGATVGGTACGCAAAGSAKARRMAEAARRIEVPRS